VKSLIYIFAYVFVPVTVFNSVRVSCAPQLRCCSLIRRRRSSDPVFRTCWPVFTCLLPYDEKSRNRRCVQTGGAISWHFQVRRCWIKIDSIVNVGETSSSEFVQCVLRVIRLTKTGESICCAVRHIETLPRSVWRTIRSPHSVWVMIATTIDTDRHRPSAANPTTPAVRRCRRLRSCHNAAASQRWLLAASSHPFWWYSWFYTML